MRQVLGSLGERVADRTADDLDADGAARALELVALGDLDGGRTGAPWAFDVEHHEPLHLSVSGIDAANLGSGS